MPAIPSVAFSIILATLIGSAAHLVFGGHGQRLLIFVLSALIGFFIGGAIGEVMGIHLLAIGVVNVFTAILGAIIATVSAAIFTAARQGDLHE